MRSYRGCRARQDGWLEVQREYRSSRDWERRVPFSQRRSWRVLLRGASHQAVCEVIKRIGDNLVCIPSKLFAGFDTFDFAHDEILIERADPALVCDGMAQVSNRFLHTPLEHVFESRKSRIQSVRRFGHFVPSSWLHLFLF